mgnify:CR=1 FL=1
MLRRLDQSQAQIDEQRPEQGVEDQEERVRRGQRQQREGAQQHGVEGQIQIGIDRPSARARGGRRVRRRRRGLSLARAGAAMDRGHDRGRRLDHMWASAELAKQATGHSVHEYARDWEKPSDHVPVWVDLNI